MYFSGELALMHAAMELSNINSVFENITAGAKQEAGSMSEKEEMAFDSIMDFF